MELGTVAMDAVLLSIQSIDAWMKTTRYACENRKDKDDTKIEKFKTLSKSKK